MRSTNPCGYAHPANKPCRLCDGARREAGLEKLQALGQEIEADVPTDGTEETGNAARCRRYRERQGPAYRKMNRQRMRKARRSVGDCDAEDEEG